MHSLGNEENSQNTKLLWKYWFDVNFSYIEDIYNIEQHWGISKNNDEYYMHESQSQISTYAKHALRVS